MSDHGVDEGVNLGGYAPHQLLHSASDAYVEVKVLVVVAEDALEVDRLMAGWIGELVE